MASSANDASVRAVHALLHANGVRVSLRVPTPASVGDDAEQLGLATPGFEDVPVGRGVFRKAENARVLLLSASAVTEACAACGSVMAEALFAGAAGVVVVGEMYMLQTWVALRVADSVYGYALTLVAPAR